MKTYSECYAQLRAYCADYAGTKSAEDAKDFEIRSFIRDRRGLYTDWPEEIRAEMDTMQADEKRLHEKSERIALEAKYAKNNALIAFASEKMPIIAEVWNKYAGKAHGPKTAEKIRAEIMERAGVRFSAYIHIDWPEIRVSDLNDYAIAFEITFYGDEERILSKENKILPMNPELRPYFSGEYVEDIPAHVEKLRAKYDEARKAQAEWLKIVDEFNALTVDGVKRIGGRSKLYTSIA